MKTLLALVLLVLLAEVAPPANARNRWTEAEANSWYQHQSWLVGSNYIPASAVNPLEMWQADTFDQVNIDRELGWARSMGMNTMLVPRHKDFDRLAG